MVRIGKIAVVAALVGMLAAAMACAGPRRFVVTVAKPAAIPVTNTPATLGMTHGALYIEIVVAHFRPSPAGPVQIVVDAGKTPVEIGRFGIYPENAFVAHDHAPPQRFRLPVPKRLRLGRTTPLTVRIVPSQGDGAGALLEVEGARLSRR